LTDTLISTKLYYFIILEILILLIHPNIFLTGNWIHYKFTTQSNILILYYEINDFLLALMIFRILYVFRFICSISYFKSTRASRISKMYGEQSTFGFAIKSLFNKYSTTFIFFLFISSMSMFSFCIRVFERNFFSRRNSDFLSLSYSDYLKVTDTNKKNIKNNLNDFENSIWCVFTTIMNVGYGDFYPQTHFGRIAMVFLVIIGTLSSGLIVVSFMKAFEFSSTENKVFVLLERMTFRDEYEDLQKKIVQKMMKYIAVGFKLRKYNDILHLEDLKRLDFKNKFEDPENDEYEVENEEEKIDNGLMREFDYRKLKDQIKKFEKIKEREHLEMIRFIDEKNKIKK